MKNIINNDWNKITVSILILLLCGFILITGCKKNNTVNTADEAFINVSPAEADAVIKENEGNTDFIIIDLRTPEEYKTGFITNAQNMDFYSSNFNSNLQALDKNKIYLIYCSSGNRSNSTINSMKSMSFKKVYNLLGGISRWIAEGYGIVTQT